MEKRYDRESDIMWIIYHRGYLDYSEEIAPGINAEYDENDKLMSVEIFNYSKQLISNLEEYLNTLFQASPSQDLTATYVTTAGSSLGRPIQTFVTTVSGTAGSSLGRPIQTEVVIPNASIQNVSRDIVFPEHSLFA
ncbi:DUF2283 domain-containing protein [Candidatus Daviesbacteria bacterium]|nr:DUF2283 domain-containing protein [Candidatus Daviesbacteria bacterium]